MKKATRIALVIVVAVVVFAVVDSRSHVSLAEPDELATPSAEATARDGREDILLVNGANPLNEDDVPKSLVNLYEQKGRHFQLAAVAIELDSAVFSAMNEMFAAANADGLEGFTITSGYRSYAGQVEVFAAQTDGTAVKPGTSEHQTGLAFDVTTRSDGDFSKTPQFEWLLAHCSDYGFILRYPQNAQTITGVPYEPWHYRYVGLPHSKIIMERGITLEEYLYQQQ